MPHICIQHFPRQLTQAEIETLSSEIAQSVQKAFHCSESVISISLDPVEPAMWNQSVFIPEIQEKSSNLIRKPNY